MRKLACALAALLACSPSGPGDPASGGGSGGGGSGGGGGDGGPGVTATSDPPTRGETAWTKKMGGLGVEWTHDVAVAPDGSVVAFNIIGVRGDALEQIGWVHMDADGREFDHQFEDEGNLAIRFAPTGSFAIAPSGNMVLAVTGVCSGGKCPTVGGAAIDGGAVVVLTGRAAHVWHRGLPGEVLSNVDVNRDGDVLVAARAGDAAALRAYDRDGALRWERTGLDLGRGAPVALDGDGNAYYAHGDAVARVDRGGARRWEQALGGGATVTAVRASAAGVVAHGSFRGTLQLAGTTLRVPAGADHGYFIAGLTADGAARFAAPIESVQEVSGPGVKTLFALDADARPVVVTGADSCSAAVSKFEPDGAPRWSRTVAVNGCGGEDLQVHGLAVAGGNRVVVGGQLSGRADLGRGPLDALAVDGVVADLMP